MARFKRNDLSGAADLVAVAMLKSQLITTSISYSTGFNYYGDDQKVTIELLSTDPLEFKKLMREVSDSIKQD